MLIGNQQLAISNIEMDNLFKDIRYGVRGLLKHPGFTAVAVLTLALGIGANTAIFSVVNAVILAPLPFPDQEQLLCLGEGTRGQPLAERGSFSYPDYKDLQAQTQTLASVAAFLNSGAILTNGGSEAERVFGADVAPEFFSVLNVKPELGRVFTRDEDRPNVGVVLISHRLWQRRFGGNTNVIGQLLKMGTATATIIGVMPAGFEYPFRAEHQDFWEPLNNRPLAGQEQRDNHSYRVIARMRPGITTAAARAELDTISRRLEQQFPNSNTAVLIAAAGLHEDLTRDARPALFILFGAVSFVLLIACANVANLLLARATSRHREIALRTALGASRWRIVRQLLVESLLLAFVGGGLGFLVAMWGTRVLVALRPATIPRADQLGVDLRVLGFTLALTVVTGIAFGLLPALQISKPEITGWLKEGARGTSGAPRRNRVRSLLVISEVALSLMLLVGAGLLLKSFVRLLHTDPGFDPGQVVALDIPLNRQRYDTPIKQALFFTQLVERTQTVPGVEAVGLVNNVLLTSSIDKLEFNIAGRPPFPLGATPAANYTVVSPGYFGAMKIPLRRGRTFSAQDTNDAPPVMLISEALARNYFAGEDPIGLRLILDPAAPPIEIVGIVGDARRRALETAAEPEFYVPFEQAPARRMNLVVRSTASNPASVIGALRGALVEMDREQTIWQTRTLEQLVADSVADRRFNLLLLGAFASVALILALLGIYGVMTYSVRQRTHEIGIRMALGARAIDVVRLVIGGGMALAFIGVAIGLVGSFALTRLMGTLLFEVTPTDAIVYATVAVSLQFAALVACYIPARRATRVDPLVALRYE